MKLGADLDTIRAAFVRTIWTLTRGVSDPARRACADPDAREAGSLTPLSSSNPLFSGRPGRQKAPADKDTDVVASIGSYEASQPGRTVRRRSSVHCRHLHPDGRWGWWPAGYRSPSSAPLAVRLVTRTIATMDGEPRLDTRLLAGFSAGRATIGERLNDHMELSDFVIGETFWTHHGAFLCTDIGTRVVVAVKLGPREIARAESVDGELRITKRIDDDPSWLNGPPYAVEEVVFDENELLGCFRTEAELLADGGDE